MTEYTLGDAGTGGDFTKERKELSYYGGNRIPDHVSCHVLLLIYSCLALYKTYIQRGKLQRQVSFRAQRALSCEEQTHDHGPYSYSCFPSSRVAKAVKRRAHTPALLLNNAELQFCLVISEVTVCLVCIKPKNKNTTRAGVKKMWVSVQFFQSVWSHRRFCVFSDGASS